MEFEKIIRWSGNTGLLQVGKILPTSQCYHSLVSHSWVVMHLRHILGHLGFKVLTPVHVNDDRDHGTGEAWRLQRFSTIDLPARNSVLLRADCKWWFQFSKNLSNFYCRPSAEGTKTNKIQPLPKRNLLCWPLPFHQLDWSFCFLFPIQIETHNAMDFLYSAYDIKSSSSLGDFFVGVSLFCFFFPQYNGNIKSLQWLSCW